VKRPAGLALTLLATASGGCALPQSDACRAYVACQAVVDDRVDTGPWEEGGDCWNLPDTARRCDAQCRAALEALLDTPDPPPACLDGAEAALADAEPP
jgi:hypothetical protein